MSVGQARAYSTLFVGGYIYLLTTNVPKGILTIVGVIVVAAVLRLLTDYGRSKDPNNSESKKGNNSLATILGLIASILTIWTFLKGVQNNF